MATTKLPKCKLTGVDGIVFILAGTVASALKKAGLPEKAKEMLGRVVECGSYDEVLVMFKEYVEVS